MKGAASFARALLAAERRLRHVLLLPSRPYRAAGGSVVGLRYARHLPVMQLARQLRKLNGPVGTAETCPHHGQGLAASFPEYLNSRVRFTV